MFSMLNLLYVPAFRLKPDKNNIDIFTVKGWLVFNIAVGIGG